ncbi:MAG: hypothetical protein PHF09_02395 [Candidatus Nanoarchaeia archaeon]|jgi:hypothetical protein|nr:hypothetical protein [Candidatus Nanoarchaeia archaeon]
MKRFIILIFLFLFYIQFNLGANAVMPSSYDVNFKPNLIEEYIFNFLLDDLDNSEIYVSGSLSEYVEVIENKKSFGRFLVKIRLTFPERVDEVGLQKIRIGIRQKEDSPQGIALLSDVGGIIRVRIPYPDKYAEGELEVNNANAGEDVEYKFTVYSRGEKDILIKPLVKILNSENEIVRSFYLDERKVKSAEQTIYEETLNSIGVLPGDYNLTISLEYGEGLITTISKIFRIGELKTKLINYTSFVEREKVQRFNVQIESLWNDEISSVYVNGSVLNYSFIEFRTPTVSLNPWQVMQLVGFLDTNGIEGDSFKMQIDINYANKTTSEIVEVFFINETNWTLIISLSVGSLILILLIVIFILSKKNKKVNSK